MGFSKQGALERAFRRGRRPRLRGCGEGGNAAASVGPRAYRHPQKADDDSWGSWAVKRATLAVRGRWQSLTTRAPTEGYRRDSVREHPARTRRSRARPRRTWAASARTRAPPTARGRATSGAATIAGSRTRPAPAGRSDAAPSGAARDPRARRGTART